MGSSSLLLLAVLLTCSVCMAQGKGVVINDDTQDQNAEDVLVKAQLPGKCKACKWALKQVKKLVGNNATVEVLKSKLLSVCNKMKGLKSMCQTFVQKHLAFLIKELTTHDDVRTICVKAKVCKPKELLESPYQQDYMFQDEVMASGDNA